MKIEIIDWNGSQIFVETDYESHPPMIDIEYPFDSRSDVCIGLTIENLNAILPMLNAFATMHGSQAAEPHVTAIALRALEIDRQAERAEKDGGAS